MLIEGYSDENPQAVPKFSFPNNAASGCGDIIFQGERSIVRKCMNIHVHQMRLNLPSIFIR